MTALKTQRRLETLLHWKQQSDARGHRTPSAQSLNSIAVANGVPYDLGEEGIESWRKTLEWLLHQVKMGVFDPVAQLPDELMLPVEIPAQGSVVPVSSAPEGNSGQSTAVPATALDALKMWRRNAIAHGRDDVAALKESTLNQILRSKQTSAGAIERMLPQSQRVLAPEIAKVLADFVGETEPPARADTARSATVDDPADIAVSTSTERTSAEGGRTRRTAAPVGTFLDLTNEDFEEFDYSSVPVTVHPIKANNTGERTVFSWPAYDADDGDVVVYRLVSKSEFPSYTPEGADYIGATIDTKVSDSREPDAAVRFVQVWANVGFDVDDATGGQAVLHAQTAVVSPVRDVQIREDEGRVIGEWTAFEGTSAVQVYRIPIERAAFGGDDPQYRISAGEPNLGGFVDRSAERGKRYLYRVRAEATVDGTTRLSAHSQTELLVSAVLAKISDLAVQVHGGDDDPQFDLTWTAPAGGRVAIYRTVGGPNAGADSASLPEAALASTGLAVDNKLSHPIVGGGAGQPSMMTNVPWPRGWNRAYFTAVTFLGDKVQVGATISATRTGVIEHAQVVERVNKQILTFAWPAGAAAVLVHVGARGQSAEQGMGGHPIEISSGMYERFGGLHFAHALPKAGCSLHLIPVAFASGERIHGQPVTVDYPGLLRVFYDANISRNVTGKPTSMTISVVAETDVQGSPPFVLIHNEERLPLNARDGVALEVFASNNETAGGAKQFVLPKLSTRADGLQFRADVKDRVGFVRLFAAMPAARLATFALLDPPVAKLTLQHGRRR
ncbi:hypothetical protein [Rhodococcus sp. MALMAid1271]|uniref:hypothetical protein n=1 Tax=Rhodococcus sp. MALMAid1271 TaxID=3411744 RepID=UPI003BA30C76